MFPNEVLISKVDKKRLVELMTEANAILEKYPYFSKPNSHTVTCMSRAKSTVKEGKQWCELLYVEEKE